MTTQAGTDDVVALIEERQQYGERSLRLDERTATPLTDIQYEILAQHEHRLDWFGLRLTADLDGTRWLHARDRVGSYRFVGEPGFELIVQVDPKVKSADVFRMLDRTNRTAKSLNEETELPVGDQPVSGVFLLYFANQASAFLKANRYRSYRFIETSSASRVKGRPRVREYALHNLPRGRAHILPTRYLDLTPNVFENQVVAYAVLVATRLTQLLGLENSKTLRSQLATCGRLLAGVEARRITAAEVRSNRLSRASRNFGPIHDLCVVLLENQSVMLDAGDRIPFAAFSLDMPDLFERYVRAVCAATIGSRFEGRKGKLEYPTGFGRPIKLDGLIVDGGRRVVIEAKYRTLAELDDEVVLGSVPEQHVYQTVAYASHELVRAQRAVIVYPIWGSAGPVVRLSGPITDFGWSRGRRRHLELRLLGLHLGADFQELVSAISPLLTPLIEPA